MFALSFLLSNKKKTADHVCVCVLIYLLKQERIFNQVPRPTQLVRSNGMYIT